jgi:spermidine/putrescine transport system substrate-binding protein
MEKNELLDRIADGRMTRRDLHKALASVGLMMMAMPVMGRAARAADQVTYFTWAGYDIPEVIPGYAEKTGGVPNWPIFSDEEEALTKLRSGFQVDVAHPCSGRIRRWRDAGIIQPMDPSRLSNFGDIFPALKSINGADEDGQQWFAAVDWGNTSVLYRTDLVDVQEDSWTLLWDERYAGKLSMGEDVTDTAIVAALLIGAADPYDMTDEELSKVKDLLAKQKPLLRFYWNDTTALEQAMATGEVVASSAWNSSVLALQRQGIPVAYMKPKEGILTWCCGLVMAKDAPEVDKAHDLIDAMISPEAGQYFISEFGYGHSNKKAFEAVDDETLAGMGLPRDPTTLLTSGVFSSDNKRQDEITQMFEAVKAGI